jgi:hypothetical protein
MSQIDNPVPSPEQAVLFARVKRMMLIASVTTAVAVGAVLIAVGYRLFHVQGSASASAGFTDVTATLPRGARITATAVAGDRIVLTVEEGGTTEIRTFDAQTLRPAGRLKFTTEP